MQTDTMTCFSSLGLSEEVSRAVEELGYDAATQIQAQTIPLIRAGYDVIGRSQTGSGKTAAFGIPAVELIDTAEHKYEVQALILCPTRELAMQGAQELRKLARYKHGVKVAELYGGVPMPAQITRLKSGSNLVIGTPGRIMDHLRRRTLKLDKLKMVVLDEADEMLSMGFQEDIETILKDVPDSRQTILFSATMPAPILELTKKYQKDPQLIEVGSRQKTVDTISQYCYDVPMGRKMDALGILLRYYDPKLAMVFCNTKKMVEELTDYLSQHGFAAQGLHGDMKQPQRTAVLSAFKNGRSSVLVATDVAARGIDVEGIDYVFNYDIPQNNEYYIHRVGRTGRAGKDGVAVTLCSGRKQVFLLQQIARAVKSRIETRPIPTMEDILQKAREHQLREVERLLALGCEEQSLAMADSLLARGHEPREILAALLQAQFGSKVEAIAEIKQERREQRDSGRAYGHISIDIGRADKIAPNHIVGALTERTNLQGRDIGKIEIYDNRSVVAVPLDELDETIRSMSGTKISGKLVHVKEQPQKDGRAPQGKNRVKDSAGKKDYRHLPKKQPTGRRKRYL